MNKSKSLILSIGCLILCASFTVIKSEYIKEKGIEGYIFPKEYILIIPSANEKERFTPTKQNIFEVESIIKDQLSTINKSLTNQIKGCPIVNRNLKKYKRQYFGFIDANGDSIVWVNFIWGKSISDSWKQDVVIILDGCSFYWNLKVNLNKKEAFDLQINGPS